MSKEKLWKTFRKHREPLLTTGWPSWEQKVKKCHSCVYAIIGGVSHFCPSHLCSWCCACVYNTKQFKSTTSPKTTAKFTSCDQSNKQEGCTVVLLGDPNKPWHFSLCDRFIVTFFPLVSECRTEWYESKSGVSVSDFMSYHRVCPCLLQLPVQT